MSTLTAGCVLSANENKNRDAASCSQAEIGGNPRHALNPQSPSLVSVDIHLQFSRMPTQSARTEMYTLMCALMRGRLVHTTFPLSRFSNLSSVERRVYIKWVSPRASCSCCRQLVVRHGRLKPRQCVFDTSHPDEKLSLGRTWLQLRRKYSSQLCLNTINSWQQQSVHLGCCISKVTRLAVNKLE